MTEIEERLLNELSSLEKQREQEQRSYEKNLMTISRNLTERYQESMNEIYKQVKLEQQHSIVLLRELEKQQREIIGLLMKPPVQQRTQEQLEKILMPLFLAFEQALIKSLNESNKSLIEELKTLL